MNWGTDPNNNPANEGWLFWYGGDPNDEKAWTQMAAGQLSEPPAGFYAQPAHPGWYLRPGVNDADLANWWHDETVPPDKETYEPSVENRPGTVAGTFAAIPSGVILHSSRSGSGNDTAAEYRGTANYAASGIELGWNATIGDDTVAQHMSGSQWGWNARGASQRYLAVEFAQATADLPISDAQVRAFCWWFVNVARAAWPGLPLVFPTHAELPEGVADGKSDVFPKGDARADQLRARILARLGFSQPAPAQGPDLDVAGDWIRDTRYSLEPDHAFTLEELWDDIVRFSGRYQIAPAVIAGMIQQESTFHNYRVHRDGTGHGLLGYDDNGLLADFERWSGLQVGRGATAAIIPVEPQIEFCAMQVRKYMDYYHEDDWVGVRAWHAGGTGRNTANGVNYEGLIKGRIAELHLG